MPMLTEVYYSTHDGRSADQYVRVENLSAQDVDLSDWSIGDGTYRACFPSGSTLAAGATFYVARSAPRFQRSFGFAPHFSLTKDSSVPKMRLPGRIPAWAVAGGQVELRDDQAALVDVLPYGNANYSGPGWNGAAVAAAEPGFVLHRRRTESSVGPDSPGQYADPTQTAADWQQGEEWVSLRLLRPGQSFLRYPSFSVAGVVRAYTSPDSSLPELLGLIDGAQNNIDLNVYQAHVPVLARHLVAAAGRGVQVRLLLEGQIFGIPSDNQMKWFAQQVHDAGGAVRYMRGDSAKKTYRRYSLDHAKYMVVDGTRISVQSENWVAHGTPVDPSYGNRGWGVSLADPALAACLTDVFNQDWNPGIADTLSYTPGNKHYGGPPAGFQPDESVRTGAYPHPFQAQDFAGPHTITPVFAPDHSLFESKAIIGLIRSAKQRLLVQQDYIYDQWGDKSGDPDSTPDLYLREVVAAARRNVAVQVLLSPDPSPSQTTNADTQTYLASIATDEGLDLTCRILDRNATGLEKIHNKGVIADGVVLVSSINWSYNSPAHNRELGLIIEDQAVADYFAAVFAWDWEHSAGGA